MSLASSHLAAAAAAEPPSTPRSSTSSSSSSASSSSSSSSLSTPSTDATGRPLAGPTPSTPSGTSISLADYSDRSLRDIAVILEIRNLEKHGLPRGLYVLPDRDTLRRLHCVIFVHKGLHAGGVFPFQVELPEAYPADEAMPSVVFRTPMTHVLVDPRSGRLNVAWRFPSWAAREHTLASLLSFVRDIFLLADDELRAIVERRGALNAGLGRLCLSDFAAFRAAVQQDAQSSHSRALEFGDADRAFLGGGSDDGRGAVGDSSSLLTTLLSPHRGGDGGSAGDFRGVGATHGSPYRPGLRGPVTSSFLGGAGDATGSSSSGDGGAGASKASDSSRWAGGFVFARPHPRHEKLRAYLLDMRRKRSGEEILNFVMQTFSASEEVATAGSDPPVPDDDEEEDEEEEEEGEGEGEEEEEEGEWEDAGDEGGVRGDGGRAGGASRRDADDDVQP